MEHPFPDNDCHILEQADLHAIVSQTQVANETHSYVYFKDKTLDWTNKQLIRSDRNIDPIVDKVKGQNLRQQL